MPTFFLPLADFLSEGRQRVADLQNYKTTKLLQNYKTDGRQRVADLQNYKTTKLQPVGVGTELNVRQPPPAEASTPPAEASTPPAEASIPPAEASTPIYYIEIGRATVNRVAHPTAP